MVQDRKITQRDLIALSSGIWRNMTDVSYFDVVKDMRRLRPFFLSLQDKRVVEIGPGNRPVNAHYRCNGYISAPGYPNDGLTVLSREPARSAVVVSFGVLDDSILGGNASRQGPRDLAKQYIEELVLEIRRVANPFSIIIGLDAEKYVGAPDIEAAGAGGVYFNK